jgi:hypothetical protein
MGSFDNFHYWIAPVSTFLRSNLPVAESQKIMPTRQSAGQFSIEMKRQF